MYKDIVKEIVETIEDDVVQIFQEYENGEADYFTYFIGSEQYNVKYVYATMDINDKQKIWLEFIVDLVTVDAEGKVTAVGVGQAEITVVCDSDNSIKDTVTVTVFPLSISRLISVSLFST